MEWERSWVGMKVGVYEKAGVDIKGGGIRHYDGVGNNESDGCGLAGSELAALYLGASQKPTSPGEQKSIPASERGGSCSSSKRAWWVQRWWRSSGGEGEWGFKDATQLCFGEGPSGRTDKCTGEVRPSEASQRASERREEGCVGSGCREGGRDERTYSGGGRERWREERIEGLKHDGRRRVDRRGKEGTSLTGEEMDSSDASEHKEHRAEGCHLT